MHKTLPLGIMICLAVSMSVPTRTTIALSDRSSSAGSLSPGAHDYATPDLTLFRGDLTPELEMACTHLDGIPPDHIPSTIGLTVSDVFAETHDCGGFHGNWMLAAEVLNETPPIELLRWEAKRSLP